MILGDLEEEKKLSAKTMSKMSNKNTNCAHKSLLVKKKHLLIEDFSN